jgi:hypothetical protein
MVDADDWRFPIYPPVERSSTWECWGNDTLRTNTCGLTGLRMKTEYANPESPFRPERGRYHFSGYVPLMDRGYMSSWDGPVVWLSAFEMDMLVAEAHIRLNQPLSAVPLINATREIHGGLAPVTGAGPVPYDDAPTNARCTPRVLQTGGSTDYANGTWGCGDLFEAMKYEKRMETWSTDMGIAYYDDRGWGDLVPGTYTQFPIPAVELMILLEDIYSFGGAPGEEGSAPLQPSLVPSENALRPLRVGEVLTYAQIQARIELFQRGAQAQTATRPSDVRRR